MTPQVDMDQLRASLQDLGRATGRRGDTFLAHITPEEADYLEKKYGGGTVNPLTGLREYAGEPGAGKGGVGEGGPGGGPGGSGGGGEGGRGGGPADAPGNVGSGVGGPQGRGRGGGGGVGESGVGSGARGAPGGPATGGSPGVSSKGMSSASPAAGRAISRALSAMLSLGFGVPTNPLSLIDEEKDLVGIPEAVRDFAEAVGKGISAFGGPSANTVGEADPQAPGVTGISGPSGVPAGGGGLPPEPSGPPDFSLRRPDAMAAPGFLGVQNAMTPIQQRSRIATFGTGGELGGFRSDPAQEYFKNIFLRSVLGDQGQIAEGAQVLPIEAQYAQQALGLDLAPETDVENFARALSDLPSREQVAEFMTAWQAAQPQPRVQEGQV